MVFTIMERGPVDLSMMPISAFETTITKVLDERFTKDWTGLGNEWSESTDMDSISVEEMKHLEIHISDVDKLVACSWDSSASVTSVPLEYGITRT